MIIQPTARWLKPACLVLPVFLTACKGPLESLTGYAASMMCSKTFVSNQDPKTTMQEDLIPITNGMAQFTDTSINRGDLSATSTLLNVKSKAIYRDGLGCTLVAKEGEAALRAQTVPAIADAPLDPSLPWPMGSQGVTSVAGVDLTQIDQAAQHHFTEHGGFQIKTSSLAVVYQGKLVYEKYAPTFQADTPVYAFSIGKTVAGLLAGVMVQDGLLNMDQPAGIDLWNTQDDARAQITPHHLLTMTSGLEFSETYDDPVSDANLLFVMDDMAAFAAAKPLVAAPGTLYNYSSGSSMILAEALTQRAGGELEDLYSKLHRDFLRKIGINTAVVQADASGNLVFAMQDLIGTQDMARLGQFMLQNGNWNGEQIVPEDWLAYMTTRVDLPNPANLDYGAGLWLNTAHNGAKFLPSLPEDTFIAMGLRGQYIIVVPSLELVIVRTGNTLDSPGLVPEIDWLAANVVKALPL